MERNTDPGTEENWPEERRHRLLRLPTSKSKVVGLPPVRAPRSTLHTPGSIAPSSGPSSGSSSSPRTPRPTGSGRTSKRMRWNASSSARCVHPSPDIAARVLQSGRRGPTPKGNPASDPRPHSTRPCPFARKVPVLAPEEAGRSLGRGNTEDETPTPVLCEKDDALDPGTTSRASSHAFPQPSHNRARPQAIALRGAHTPGSHKNRNEEKQALMDDEEETRRRTLHVLRQLLVDRPLLRRRIGSLHHLVHAGMRMSPTRRRVEEAAHGTMGDEVVMVLCTVHEYA
ncbi:hypothetical protein B0H13DRAFT_2374108 [Mycena leptocephala]|nr:hypothetical protein B0H13DRAFT_2374108 [Mycena leptocephala]